MHFAFSIAYCHACAGVLNHGLHLQTHRRWTHLTQLGYTTESLGLRFFTPSPTASRRLAAHLVADAHIDADADKHHHGHADAWTNSDTPRHEV